MSDTQFDSPNSLEAMIAGTANMLSKAGRNGHGVITRDDFTVAVEELLAENNASIRLNQFEIQLLSNILRNSISLKTVNEHVFCFREDAPLVDGRTVYSQLFQKLRMTDLNDQSLRRLCRIDGMEVLASQILAYSLNSSAVSKQTKERMQATYAVFANFNLKMDGSRARDQYKQRVLSEISIRPTTAADIASIIDSI